jgi:hypothetical protein
MKLTTAAYIHEDVRKGGGNCQVPVTQSIEALASVTRFDRAPGSLRLTALTLASRRSRMEANRACRWRSGCQMKLYLPLSGLPLPADGA